MPSRIILINHYHEPQDSSHVENAECDAPQTPHLVRHNAGIIAP